MRPLHLAAALVLLSLLAPVSASALGAPPFVTSAPTGPRAFALFTPGHPPTLVLDPAELPGVTRAAHDLARDLEHVTGTAPALTTSVPQTSVTQTAGPVILIGTLGHSPLIDSLVRARKVDVHDIAGHWETSVTQIVDHPLPGIPRALVIAGADKRGTIFALYGLSEQIGVSPWAWWADVPIPHRDTLYISPGRHTEPEPAVRYRGIFLNDEAPSLTNWVNEKFGGFNAKFYTHVFELILRLRGNYLWPAMWGSAFNEDDPENPRLADEYGIVMGTSHHEPMIRAQQEWKRHGTGPWDYTTNAPELQRFWEAGIERNRNFESTITLAMRGDGDKPMSAEANTSLLEKIVADQRAILARHATPTLQSDPQVWALYKEVQEYYEKGMRVPPDVTLLWSDDNWGNIRRLPTPEERRRPGGAGIYYHVDYVGGPRSYKWLNTYPLPKIWEQMNLALHYGADRIWILNVGDLKPMEIPIEFFLTLGRTPALFDPSPANPDPIRQYLRAVATRDFGPEHASEIADLIAGYTHLNGRRKPEQVEPNTFSLTADHEADHVEREWLDLTARAEKLNAQLPPAQQPAFFQLVLYPLKASGIVTRLNIAAGRNHLFAAQGRASANDAASDARRLFAEDAALTRQFHTLLDGKWNHMMDQTHLGYISWNDPPLNAMPAVSEVQPLPGAHMGVAAEGFPPFRPTLPTFDPFNNQTRTIDLLKRGSDPFSYTLTTSADWIRVFPSDAHVPPNVSVHPMKLTGRSIGDRTLDVTIDWSKAPPGTSRGTITITDISPSPRISSDHPVTIAVEAINPTSPTRANVIGFVENSGAISIEAEHFGSQSSSPGSGVRWQLLPGFGRTLSGLTPMPVDAPSAAEPAHSACLNYPINNFHPGPWTFTAITAPTLAFVPGRGIRFAVALDDASFTTLDIAPRGTVGDGNAAWEKEVSDGVAKTSTPLSIPVAGPHTLHVCYVDPGIVLEKFVLTFDAPAPAYTVEAPSNAPRPQPPSTYLGPPESFFHLPSHP